MGIPNRELKGRGEIMDKLRFTTPAYFTFFHLIWAMGLVLAVGILLKWYFRPRQSRSSHYRLFGGDWAWLLAILFCVLGIVALAGPQISSGYGVSQSGSVDVLVFLDNSASMATKDVKPSRQELAKNAALNLVEKRILRPGDRVTIFVFGGIARWRMPLSEDWDDFKAKVAEVSHPAVYEEESQLDTDFAYLLEYASKSIDRQDNFTKSNQAVLNLKSYFNNRLAFIFSDGNDESERKLENGLRELSQRKVKIYAVGIGTKTGGTITIRAYDHSDPHKPPEKITIKTKLEMKALQKIAQATEGDIFVLDSEYRQTQLESFMRGAVNANRSALPRLVYSEKGRDIWWEFLAVSATVIFFFMICLAV